jgi:hypothetical protein
MLRRVLRTDSSDAQRRALHALYAASSGADADRAAAELAAVEAGTGERGTVSSPASAAASVSDSRALQCCDDRGTIAVQQRQSRLSHPPTSCLAPSHPRRTAAQQAHCLSARPRSRRRSYLAVAALRPRWPDRGACELRRPSAGQAGDRRAGQSCTAEVSASVARARAAQLPRTLSLTVSISRHHGDTITGPPKRQLPHRRCCGDWSNCGSAASRLPSSRQQLLRLCDGRGR